MMWKKYSLGSVSVKIDYGYTESATFDIVGPKFLRITDIVSSQINWDAVPYCTISSENFEKYKLEYGDIVIARTGATSGFNAIFEKDIDAVFASYLIRFKINREIAIPKFISYLLHTSEYRGFISGAISGAAQPGINAQILSSFSFCLPPLNIQEKIVFLLSAYDSLIENNTRRIALLEKMAQELYKEWFVRFRFPGHEQVKMVNGVPEGWSIKRLSEFVDIIMGQSPCSDNYNKDSHGLPFHQGISDYGFRFVEDTTYTTEGVKIAKASSILFSVRAPVGRINITRHNIVIGRGLAAINHKENLQNFLYYMLKNKFYKDDLLGNGSVYFAVTKNELYNQKFLYPPNELCKRYNEIVKNIDLEIATLDEQTHNLTKQRDLLLPRLMSGKLELP